MSLEEGLQIANTRIQVGHAEIIKLTNESLELKVANQIYQRAYNDLKNSKDEELSNKQNAIDELQKQVVQLTEKVKALSILVVEATDECCEATLD